MERKIITGLELASYLQMLAIEKQTCLLRVQWQELEGILCMKNGCLLDAQTRGSDFGGGCLLYRENAVIEMLRWKMPEIEFLPLDRSVKKKINKSLEFLLLESCRFQDEAGEADVEKSLSSEGRQPSDDMPMLIKRLMRNRHIISYLILDSQGDIVAKKDEENSLDADFLSFVQFTFNSYGPEILPDAASGDNINFTLKNNRAIMVYVLKNNVLGLLVDSRIACEEVEKHVTPLLSCLQTLEPNMAVSVPL